MPAMVRKQIYIKPEQDRQLKRLARKTGATEAEVIRQALDRLARDSSQEEQRLQAWNETLAFIEQRMKKGPVSAPRRRWSREETHER